MKISKMILALLIAVLPFISCSKDNDDDKEHTIEGRWVGTYFNATSNSTYYFSFDIKNGGAIQEINSAGDVVGTGQWELNNNILEAHYTWTGGGDFSVVAAFDKHAGRLLGDWGFGNSTTNGGTWEMTKPY